jgi:hypothetical protein
VTDAAEQGGADGAAAARVHHDDVVPTRPRANVNGMVLVARRDYGHTGR